MTRLPLAPWLWPLALPLLMPVVSALVSLLRQWGVASSWNPEALPGLLPGFGVTVLVTLPVTLLPALLALLTLRHRAAADGVMGHRLAALWGLCLGLSVTWLLFLVLSGGSWTLLTNLVFWPPLLGYVLGRWAGGGQ